MSDRFDITDLSKGEDSKSVSKTDKLSDALAANMEGIISIVKVIVDTQKMKVQSEAVLRKIEADKAMLIAEAEVYVMKKNADIKEIVDKMQIARVMLQDFYKQKNTSGVTAEEFSTIIKAIFDQRD